MNSVLTEYSIEFDFLIFINIRLQSFLWAPPNVSCSANHFQCVRFFLGALCLGQLSK